MLKAAGVVLLGMCVACGPSSRDNGGGDDDDGTHDAGGGGDDSGGPGSGSACATSMSKAEKTPLDIFIMLDHSASMQDNNKWQSVTSAIDTFVTQPSLTGVSVGLQYFGVPPSNGATCSTQFCATDSDCGASTCGPCLQFGGGVGICEGASSGTDSCSAIDYATAAVAIAALPGNASAIQSSIASHDPDGDSTPTEPALAGALRYGKTWAQAHAGDAVVVVFATDGEPTGCASSNSVSQAETDAMAAATGTPKIPTYVIGVGSDLGNLDGIAQAGATGSAFFVDTGGNANQQFLDAMNAIQHTALGCQYAIPDPPSGQSLDYGEVNVSYTPGGSGAPVTIPNVPSAAQCPANGDAWYYDNVNAPTQILLCSSTCSKVTADASGEVDIELGCATIIE